MKISGILLLTLICFVSGNIYADSTSSTEAPASETKASSDSDTKSIDEPAATDANENSDDPESLKNKDDSANEKPLAETGASEDETAPQASSDEEDEEDDDELDEDDC